MVEQSYLGAPMNWVKAKEVPLQVYDDERSNRYQLRVSDVDNEIKLQNFGALTRHHLDDFKDLPSRPESLENEIDHAADRTQELDLNSDRSAYVAPKYWLKRDDQFLAERPLT